MNEIIKELENRIEYINKELHSMREINSEKSEYAFNDADFCLKMGIKSGLLIAIQTIKEHLDKQSS